MHGPFDGMTGLVTGASDGLGRSLARALAARGMTVAVAARRADRLAALAAEIDGLGGPTAIPVAVDLTEPGAAAALAQQAIERCGRVDVLVNNAGVLVSETMRDGDCQAARALFEVNYWSPVALTAALAPQMGQGGMVVNISSVAQHVPFPCYVFYGASKAGLSATTEAARHEFSADGVSVVHVLLGQVGTAMYIQARAGASPGARLVTRLGAPSPDRAAEVIANGMVRRKRRIVYPVSAQFARRWPALTARGVDAAQAVARRVVRPTEVSCANPPARHSAAR